MAIVNDFYIDYKNKLIVHATTTVNYSGLSGTFLTGETVTASGTALVVSDNGSNSMTVTRVTGTLSGTITGGTSGATATISSTPSITTTYTVQALYTLIQDSLDEAATVDDTIPITASTPTDFTLINGWFTDDVSTQFLYGGGLATSGWNTEIYVLKFLSGGTYTNAVNTDIGKTVQNSGPTHTGTLLAFNNTTRTWWVRKGTSTFSNNEALTINPSGTGAGTTLTSGGVTTGEAIWANVYTIGSITTGTNLYVVQNYGKLTAWWGANHIDILVKVQEAGSLIDFGYLIIFARSYGDLFDHYVAAVSGGGRTPIPLSTSTDINNTTAQGTIAALTGITFDFGATNQNIGDGGGNQPYDVIVNCGGNFINKFYEYTKYITRGGSTGDLDANADQTVYGEQYLATGLIKFNYDGETGGPFTEGETITGTGVSGVVTSVRDTPPTGSLVVREVRGTFTDNLHLTGSTSGAQADVNGTVTDITVSKVAPFGTFAGGKFFGARGVWIYNMHANDANNYQLLDSNNVSRLPPTSVSVAVNGVVSGDSVGVFRATDQNGSIDKTYLTLASGNTSGSTTLVVNQTIPTDTPSSGVVRVVDYDDNTDSKERRYSYTSITAPSTFNGITKLFGTLDAGLDRNYTANDDTAYVPYIDATASGTSASVSVQFAVVRNISTRVRRKGILPFTLDNVNLTSSGYTVTAIRTADTIAD